MFYWNGCQIFKNWEQNKAFVCAKQKEKQSTPAQIISLFFSFFFWPMIKEGHYFVIGFNQIELKLFNAYKDKIKTKCHNTIKYYDQFMLHGRNSPAP